MTDPTCCAADREPDRGQPPALSELRWRSATWASARARMLALLPRQTVPPTTTGDEPTRPLAALTTRADDDPTIALVDAWAAACDVLSFYAERLLNEGYIGTAVEDRSVIELARALGYRRAPGVAAGTHLAFTVDEQTPGGEVTVAAGTPVMSVPAQDEAPVTFATTETLVARAAHNLLSPRRHRPQTIAAGQTELVLTGVDTGLRPGDAVVVVGAERDSPPGDDASERWDLRQAVTVEPDAEAGRTTVVLDDGLGDGFTSPAATDVRVVAFDGRGRLFGADAPDVRMMSADVRENAELVKGGQWTGWPLAGDRTRTQLDPAALDLDREYAQVAAGGWVCLQGPTEVELYRVERVNPAGRADFSLTGTVTRVLLDGDEHLDRFGRRGTSVLLGSRELALAEVPDSDAVAGVTIELEEGAVPLAVGRLVLVAGTGEADGEPSSTVATVVAWTDGAHPTVELDVELPRLVRDTVVVYGNVARATHGAPVGPEVAGSGDASVGHQTLELAQAPLTWVQDPTGEVRPELEVTVAGERWETVETLYGAGPRDRVLAVSLTADGRTRLTAGDGRSGARLPSGTENVSATYRTGIGRSGDVAAGQLSLLQQRPPGLLAVTNPAAATGGADPDDPGALRDLAPRSVLTLGRLVSLQDYEDHAAAWPGVGKARADALWDGSARFVNLTLASSAGAPFATTDDTLVALAASVDRIRDPSHRVVLAGFTPVTIALDARIVVDPALDRVLVFAAVRASLVERFGFAARAFGQPVLAADVVATVQGVDGVVALDLESLRRTTDTTAPPPVPPVALVAALPTWADGATTPAELLVLASGDDVALTGWEDSP